MIKADIAKRIHQQIGISETEATKLMEWILELIKTALQKGEPISIINFGVFTVRHKVARRFRLGLAGTLDAIQLS